MEIKPKEKEIWNIVIIVAVIILIVLGFVYFKYFGECAEFCRSEGNKRCVNIGE